jgi:hypothetical protein
MMLQHQLQQALLLYDRRNDRHNQLPYLHTLIALSPQNWIVFG